MIKKSYILKHFESDELEVVYEIMRTYENTQLLSITDLKIQIQRDIFFIKSVMRLLEFCKVITFMIKDVNHYYMYVGDPKAYKKLATELYALHQKDFVFQEPWRKIKLSHKEFIEQIQESNPEIEILSLYKGMNKYIVYQCECGEIDCEKASFLLHGHKHEHRLKWTHEKFVKEVAINNPGVEILELFISTNREISFKCFCGALAKTRAYNLLKGNGCGCRIGKH